MGRRYTPELLRSLRNDIDIAKLIAGPLDLPWKMSEGYFRFLCPTQPRGSPCPIPSPEPPGPRGSNQQVSVPPTQRAPSRIFRDHCASYA